MLHDFRQCFQLLLPIKATGYDVYDLLILKPTDVMTAPLSERAINARNKLGCFPY